MRMSPQFQATDYSNLQLVQNQMLVDIFQAPSDLAGVAGTGWVIRSVALFSALNSTWGVMFFPKFAVAPNLPDFPQCGYVEMLAADARRFSIDGVTLSTVYYYAVSGLSIPVIQSQDLIGEVGFTFGLINRSAVTKPPSPDPSANLSLTVWAEPMF